MERTQIYLDKGDKDSLIKMAKIKGVSMAEVIREAVCEYLAKEQKTALDCLSDSGGIWKDREDITDSDDFVSEMRKRWFVKKEDK